MNNARSVNYNEVDEQSRLLGENKYKVYKQRWFQLVLFSMVSMSNAIVWITFAPISDFAQHFYGITLLCVNVLSVVFMAGYLPCGFLASWTIDRYGLRFGVLTGTLFTLIGTWIRVTGRWSYWLTLLGQSLAAIGQPFILNAVPKLAANWFPDDQRTIATTIASCVNPVGVAVGYVIPSLLASTASDLPVVLLHEAIIVSGLCIPTLLFFKDKPASPPSGAASVERYDEYFPAVKRLLCDKNFLVVLLQFSLGLGAFNTLATILNEMLEPFGYSDTQSGYMGAGIVLSGLVGAGIVGALVDKTRKYKLFLLIEFVCAIGSLGMFAFFLEPDKFYFLLLASCILGFFMTPVLPVSLELSCEISYPIGEATPTGLLMIGGQISGIAMTFGLGYLLKQPSTVLWAIWATIICLGCAFIITLFFKGTLNRFMHESSMANKGVS